MTSGGFGFRAYTFFDTLLWIACLNMLWIVFTLLGGVVLGIGPSTAAAHILVREKVQGSATPLMRRYAKEYFKNFAKGNALGVPVLVVAAALALNWGYFSAGWDLGSQVASAAILLAVLATTTLAAMHLLAEAVAAGAPGWLNLGFVVLGWDSIKFGLAAASVALRCAVGRCGTLWRQVRQRELDRLRVVIG